MPKAAAPLTDPTAWVELDALTPVSVAGKDMRLAFVEGQSPEWAAEQGLVVGDIARTAQPDDPTLSVTGYILADVAGVPTQIWQTVAKPLSAQKVDAERMATARYDTERVKVMPWDFGSTLALDDLGEPAGEAGVQHLQMREAPRNDVAAWQAVALAASVAVGAGSGSTVMPIKALSNLWIQTTAAQLLQVLVTGDVGQLSALSRQTAILARFGELKASIAAASDAEALAAARAAIVTGWPA